jgi:alkylation response protein AidB-like acyl-CoA dehydrogenase
MINYELNEKDKKLQMEAAAFCAKEIAPRAKMLDEATQAKKGELVKENLKKLSQAGILGVSLGSDKVDMVSHYVASEELAKACASTFLSARSSIFLCGASLNLFGTKEQKEKYLPGLKSATIVGGLAYSEEAAGSDLAGIATAAKKDGDAWVLNGTKDIVVNAPIADVLLVLAYTDKDAGLAKGMSLFIVEKGAKGLIIGEPLDTMGVKGAPIASVKLDKCVAKEIVGGVAGNGYAQVSRILDMGKIGVAAMCVGIGVACMERATLHAKSRRAFGKAIGSYQEVGFKLADMFTNNDVGRLLALRAAWAMNTGEAEAEIIASCAKLFAGEGVTRIANLAMQVFAGHGYIKGTDIERLYRDARFGEICEGTTEIQRVLIAKKELDKFLPA